MREIRYAARLLLRNPSFTAIAVACLALGIGATTAIFSVVDGMVFRPLPYASPDRLVRLYTEFPNFPNGGLRRFPVSPPEFRELQRDLRSFEQVEAYSTGATNVTTSGEPQRVTAAFVSGGMLAMLGARPERGRIHTAADDREGAPLTAIVSHGLWVRAFGADPGLAGREIKINGMPTTVIGIMPEGFQFPPAQADASEIWLPLQLTQQDLQRRGNHRLSLIGKLSAGVGLDAAREELNSKLREWGARASNNFHSMNSSNHPVIAHAMKDEVVRTVKPAMLAILGAAGFVLLIACVNVANLLLARAEARQKEMAVRLAIGAGARGLLRQFFIEALLLVAAGCALGLAIAYAGVRILLAAGSESIPRSSEIGIDLRVLLFSFSLLLATSFIFALAPMAQALGRNLHETLKATAGRTSATVQANLLRRGLVVVQLALALILLISTALMVRSFWRLQAVDVGFDTRNLLTMRLALPAAQYSDSRSVNSFLARLEERLDRLPGAAAAGIMAGLPPQRPAGFGDTLIENFVPRPGGPVQNVDFWQFVGHGAFRTLNVRLREGRLLDERDVAGAVQTVVVNETMARTFWPGQSALGQRIKLPSPNAEWLTIVGVVEDVKNFGPDRPAGTEIFAHYRQLAQPLRFVQIAVRTRGEPLQLAGAVRGIIAELDSSLPVAGVRSMDDVVAATLSRPRFLSVLLSLFTVIALLLAAIGVYGVVAYSVAQRTAEIGVRMAIGAQPGQIVSMILRQGLLFAIGGIGMGLLGSLWLTRFLRSFLFGIDPFEPLTFSAMIAALGAVTLVACWIPAKRAAKVDPLIALRYE